MTKEAPLTQEIPGVLGALGQGTRNKDQVSLLLYHAVMANFFFFFFFAAQFSMWDLSSPVKDFPVLRARSLNPWTAKEMNHVMVNFM